MPPRRGWGIFGLGFYKDVAPTALGNYFNKQRAHCATKLRLRFVLALNKYFAGLFVCPSKNR
jgi:hypothetical protein